MPDYPIARTVLQHNVNPYLFHNSGPRQEPHVEPVNGVVQPPVVPPPSRPGRMTNQLLYLKNTVMKGVLKHQHSWPFMTPVDTVNLGLPDYFKIIKRPMDLGTVRKRLENKYYWRAQECVDDVTLMFANCYMYNKPGEDVVIMAQSLEKFFLNKVKSMPPVEVAISVAGAGGGAANKNKSRGRKVRGKYVDCQIRGRKSKKQKWLFKKGT